MTDYDLLLRRMGNLIGHLFNRSHTISDRLQRRIHFPCLLNTSTSLLLAAPHHFDHLLTRLLQVLNHMLDLFGRGLSARSQSTNFIRHHRKTASGISGTRGFNRRIECQQIGLLGDTADHIQNTANVITKLAQFMGNAHGRFHITR
ncbi:Uncharacterised protein [Vibrio cholerae]|nr:Uncharacterised protein [Vibrio cholerae]